MSSSRVTSFDELIRRLITMESSGATDDQGSNHDPANETKSRVQVSRKHMRS